MGLPFSSYLPIRGPAPCPVGDDGVDQAGDERCVDQVGLELDAAGYRSRDDRRRGCGEHDLEQPLGATFSVVEEEVAVREPSADARAAVRQAKADGPIHETTNGKVHHVLHDDVAGVLGASESGLDEREARLHQHHERCRQHQPHLVRRGGDLFNGLGRADPSQRSDQQRGHETSAE